MHLMLYFSICRMILAISTAAVAVNAVSLQNYINNDVNRESSNFQTILSENNHWDEDWETQFTNVLAENKILRGLFRKDKFSPLHCL